MGKRNLVLVGDIHGEFRTLVWNATERYKLEDADIVVLGDFGVGFDGTIPGTYAHLEKKLKKHNLHLWALRGNHDDPEWFDGTHDFEFLTFLQDHREVEIAGNSCYVIGGAASTDIEWRLKRNNEAGHKYPVWWEGEYIAEKPAKDLPGRVDIILSHDAPLAFEPVTTRFSETPEWQYEKIVKGREYLSQVLQETTTDYWYYGHYHKHYSGSWGNVLYKGLGIQEFYQHYGNK